jgi:two-component system, cell cycle sensor histidine kinase and response regulator CckA
MRTLSHSACSITTSAWDAFPAAADLRNRDDRLQALKTLVAHFTHDFNNSLMPVAGYISLLADEIQAESAGSMYISRLGNCLHKTEEFIQTVLHATHPERHFLPRETNLTALLQRTVEVWMKALPSSAQITVDVDLARCTMWLDEAQWSKVIQHLLRNAQAALEEEGGRVRLALSEQQVTAEQAAMLGVTGTSLVELTVEDTGCGMSEEVLSRAYDPFFTTRSGSATRGLGLTLVHSVVRLHGGQIDLASIENTGTRVRIWLPTGCNV